MKLSEAQRRARQRRHSHRQRKANVARNNPGPASKWAPPPRHRRAYALAGLDLSLAASAALLGMAAPAGLRALQGGKDG